MNPLLQFESVQKFRKWKEFLLNPDQSFSSLKLNQKEIDEVMEYCREKIIVLEGGLKDIFNGTMINPSNISKESCDSLIKSCHLTSNEALKD